MGVTLPGYTRKVQKQEQAAEMPANKTVSKTEFSSPVPDAIENAGEKLDQHAKAYADYVVREENRQRQDLILKTKNKITSGIDDILYNNEPDEKGQIKGLMFRSGDVENLTEVGTKSIEELIQNNLQGIDDADVVESIKQKIFETRQSSIKLLANREVRQKQENSAEIINASLAADMKTASGISESGSMQNLISNVDEYISAHYKNLGAQDIIVTVAQENARERLLQNSLATLLEVGNTKAAREILDSCKDKVSAGFFAKSNTLIRGKEIDDITSRIWDNAQNIRTAQGYVDLNHIYGQIEKTGLTDKEKKSVYSSLSSMANADKQRIAQERADQDRNFENEVLKMFKEKQDYKEAVKFAANSGFDEVDIALKQKYVDNVYFEKEGKSDPQALLNLYDKKFSGELTKNDIDNAYAAGEIRSADWMIFRKDFADKGFNLVDGTYLQGQQIKADIDAFAEEKASDDYTQAEIKTFFYSQLRGKPYDEARKTFEDLQKAPGAWNFTPNYKKQLISNRESRELASKYSNVFMDATGKRNLSTLKFIDGIKKGAELQKIDNFNANYIDDIIDFCGADNLKNPESVEFQALEYLISHNKTITIPDIKATIEQGIKNEKI